jgi:hypothetical protein
MSRKTELVDSDEDNEYDYDVADDSSDEALGWGSDSDSVSSSSSVSSEARSEESVGALRNDANNSSINLRQLVAQRMGIQRLVQMIKQKQWRPSWYTHYMRIHTYEAMVTHDGFNRAFEYTGHNLQVRRFTLARALTTPASGASFEFLSTDAKSLQARVARPSSPFGWGFFSFSRPTLWFTPARWGWGRARRRPSAIRRCKRTTPISLGSPLSALSQLWQNDKGVRRYAFPKNQENYIQAICYYPPMALYLARY